jgi:hypothetical protein
VVRLGFGGVVRLGFGGVVRLGFGGVVRLGFSGVVRLGFSGVVRLGFSGEARFGFGGVARVEGGSAPARLVPVHNVVVGEEPGLEELHTDGNTREGLVVRGVGTIGERGFRAEEYQAASDHLAPEAEFGDAAQALDFAASSGGHGLQSRGYSSAPRR